MDSPFDVLAKTVALAEGMPRREAVRRVGGALAAVALSSLGVGCSSGGGRSPSMSPLPPGTSSTGRTPQGGGTADCDDFCQLLPGAQGARCRSDAAHGAGLCVQCAGDPLRLCPTGAGGAYACCPAGDVCVDRACVSVSSLKNCVPFCRQLPRGPQQLRCLADALKGTGLCVQCAADASRLCAPTSGGGAYVCCDVGVSCINGQCGCPSGQTLCGSTCCASGRSCVGGRCCVPSGGFCTADTAAACCTGACTLINGTSGQQGYCT
jgi:hypothetical protein